MPDSTIAGGREKPSFRLLTKREAAEFTGLTLDQYRSLRKHGIHRGPDFERRGHRIFYPLPALEEWLAQKGGQANG